MLGILLALLSALALGSSQILVRKNLDKSNFVYIALTVTIVGNIIHTVGNSGFFPVES